MSGLYPLLALARENRLSERARPYKDWLTSEEFEVRSEFAGGQALCDSLAVTHYLLERIALDPKSVPLMLSWLADGTVSPYYFQVINPVPLFFVEPGSDEHNRLMAAVHANLKSRRFEAARRVLRLCDEPKAEARDRLGRACCSRRRESQTWPEPDDYKKNYEAARALENQNLAELKEVRSRLLDRFLARKARMVRVASPVGGFYEFMEDIALKVFCPAQHS